MQFADAADRRRDPPIAGTLAERRSISTECDSLFPHCQTARAAGPGSDGSHPRPFPALPWLSRHPCVGWASGIRGKRWSVGPAQTAPPIWKAVPWIAERALCSSRLAPDAPQMALQRVPACAMAGHQTGQTGVRRAPSRISRALPVSSHASYAPLLTIDCLRILLQLWLGAALQNSRLT